MCLLFDLDNTCVGYHDKKPTLELAKLFKKLQKKGFRVIIFSNAPKKRLIPFKDLQVICHHSSKKPFRHNFIKIINQYHYQPSEVCIIGDQLFTDIYGGNRVGITTCLVNPLTQEDFILTKLLRKMETKLFKKMSRTGAFKRGEYYE